MTDFMTPKQRSRCMSRVRGKDTSPEIYLRKMLWANGFRYRLKSKLPGKPDIVLQKHKVVIFVNGCFWHSHKGCLKSKLPSTREEFWSNKIASNTERDKRNIAELKRLGWRIAIVWECCIKNQKSKAGTVESLSNWILSNSEWVETALD
ncbi:putative very short patch repair endonuclease [Geobacter sp. OR-1]|uniref:very short patch repair endonuclease n=1 Tax=Geobacter sp. OR-1 TaxID=1266765 RepID=UPI000542D28B|nr:putative very short patch repair endonuclease [Geobacter sp. OR-1]